MIDLLKQSVDIAEGHINELLGRNEDISQKRLAVCKKCPLLKDTLGGVCNYKLYMNPETLEVSETPKEGFKRGCGCRVQAKTRLPYAKCPLDRW